MLERQDSGRHKDGNLLGVRNCLEGGPDGDFRFSKTYVTADEAVHRIRGLHIFLHSPRGLFLVRRIIVHKGRFQLLLQIGIGREGKTAGGAAFGVKLDKFFGNVLYAGLCR